MTLIWKSPQEPSSGQPEGGFTKPCFLAKGARNSIISRSDLLNFQDRQLGLVSRPLIVRTSSEGSVVQGAIRTPRRDILRCSPGPLG